MPKTQNNEVTNAAKEREAEMQPTPVVRESFDSMQRRVDPVKTEGTTEVPANGVTAPVDAMQQRFQAAEEQKEKDIATLNEQSDGKPKV